MLKRRQMNQQSISMSFWAASTADLAGNWKRQVSLLSLSDKALSAKLVKGSRSVSDRTTE